MPINPNDEPNGHARFTVDGSPRLEQHLSRTCELVDEEMCKTLPLNKLEGVLLGGGYGRGEGGVLKSSAGEQPYNDLEFYLLMRGNPRLNERRCGHELEHIAHTLSAKAGVEVEFKILSRSKLQNSPVNMFYYDLVMGHRWVKGDDHLLAGCEHLQHSEKIPLAEATRLLFNRCSGLLFAQEKLTHDPLTADDADFIGRNQNKAKLALGDVVLAGEGQYDWSCRTRHQRLLSLEKVWPWFPEVQRYHAEGLAFKLHPQRTEPNHPFLLDQQTQLTRLALELWLWLESRRLGENFNRPEDYALSPINKCPENAGARNILINAAVFGVGGLLRRPWRYPRERLFNSLSLLLWVPGTLGKPRLLQFTQRELETKASGFSDLLSAYRKLWQRFN